MRIGVDVSFLATDRRGMGRYVRNLLTCLLRHPSTHRYVLFTGRGTDAGAVRSLLGRVPVDYEIALSRDCSRADLDVCWFPWSRIDRLPRTGKAVLTVHDVAPFLFPHRSRWRYFDQRRDERRLAESVTAADAVVTVSRFSCEQLATVLAVPRSRLEVVPGGVDPLFWQSEPQVAHRDEIMCVARDEERKNLGRLLEAFVLLRREGRAACRLRLCGVDPDAAPRYARLLKPDRLENEVTWESDLDDRVLRERYRAAALVVCPSLHEGFGLPVIEAMASGTPVACANAASLPEIAGDAAVYFDPLDAAGMAGAISRCLADEELRTAMIDKGRTQAARFDWVASARKMHDVLESVAGLDVQAGVSDSKRLHNLPGWRAIL